MTHRTEPATLEARGVAVHFAGVRALSEIDFVARQGALVGLIGPNGAGKTTLLNVLSGFQRPTTGTVHFAGADITRWVPRRRARHGIARSFQNVRLFEAMTVFENVEVSAMSAGAGRRTAQQRAWDLLDAFGLADVAGQLAGGLPYGAERRLGIARCLAGTPRILLLDEPAAGLNEAETDDLMAVLRELPHRFDCGLVVIEHDMRLIMQLCEELHVLDYGRTIAVGSPDAIRTDAAVIEAYLGAAP